MDNKDISDDNIIKDALILNGFNPSLTDSGLLEGAETFSRNTEDAINANVFGSPSYVVNDQVFFGQDRLDYLENYLLTIT